MTETTTWPSLVALPAPVVLGASFIEELSFLDRIMDGCPDIKYTGRPGDQVVKYTTFKKLRSRLELELDSTRNIVSNALNA